MISDSARKRLERAIRAVLLVALVASLTGVGYLAVAQPSATDPYTEFYVVGSSGNASDYPTNLTAGDAGAVTVGISNREGQDLTYSIVLSLNETTVTSDAITVGGGDTREQLIPFTPEEPGRYRLRIDLYRGPVPDETAEPYRTLWLWIDVSEAES